jgi:hypothetical protein
VETSGTQRLRVEAAGNVNFANNVNVSGTSTVSGIAQFANTINLTHASAGQNYIYFNEDLQLAKNGTGTRLKIDSDGRVLIGQTSSVNGVYGSPPPRFSVSTTTASPAIFATYSNDVYGSRIDLIKSRATTVGGTTVVQAGDAIGEIVFGGADGDQFHPTAIIQSTVEAGVGDNDMPGALLFYTNGGATTGTERMRINSAGYITAPYQPAFSMYINNNQLSASYNTGTQTMPFGETNTNIGGHFKTSGSDQYKFVAPVAGQYFFSLSQNHTARVDTRIMKNNDTFHGGENEIPSSQTDSAWHHHTLTCVMTLAVGDKVYCTTNNQDGNPLRAWNGNTWDNFSGYLIG